MFSKIIIVSAFGRSGSGILTSLLDGHSNIINFPDALLSGYYLWWNQVKNYNLENKIKSFIKTYNVIFDPKDEKTLVPGLGYNFGIHSNFNGSEEMGTQDIKINKLEFSEILKETTEHENTQFKFFIKIHEALAKVLSKNNKSLIILVCIPNLIVKKIEFLLNQNNLKVYHLQMIREPYYSHLAQINNWIEDKQLIENPIRRILQQVIKHNNPIKISNIEKRCVKLEELHKFPEKTLSSICDFFKIGYEKIITRSTFFKIDWLFAKNKKYFQPFNEDYISIEKYKYIDDKELKSIFQFLFKEMYVKWNYDLSINLSFYIFFFKKTKIEKIFKTSFIEIIKIRIIIFFMILSKLLKPNKEILPDLIESDSKP